jgi:hypothetical protein
MSKRTLTREQLDKACDQEGVLHLQAKCHPNAPFLIHYAKVVGAIVIHCGKCGTHIDSVAVAPIDAVRKARLTAMQKEFLE